MVKIMTNEIYSDLNQYKPQLKPVLTDIECIYQSLYNLFGIDEYERLFRPEIKGSIDDETFGFVEEDSSFAILAEQINRVKRFEPRVIPDFGKSKVVLNEDENRYDLILAFQVAGAGVDFFEFSGSFFR